MSSEVTMKNEEYTDAGSYWRHKLSGEAWPVKLFHDFASRRGYSEGCIDITMGTDQSDKILQICKANDFLLFVFMSTVYKVFLSKLTLNKDIAVCAPLFNAEVQDIGDGGTGFVIFSDTLDNGMTFKSLLQNIRQTILNGYKYQYFDFDSVLDTVFSSSDYLSAAIALENISLPQSIARIISSGKNEILLSIWKKGDVIVARFIYNASLYEKDTMEYMGRYFNNVLEQVTSNTNILLGGISLANGSDSELVSKFMDTTDKYDLEGNTFISLFEEQVQKTPLNKSVIYSDGFITYSELNGKANQLARMLAKAGAGLESIVAVLIDYSPDMVTAILGVLKSGGAYLPMDPSYPDTSIQRILKSSGARFLVTRRGMLSDRKIAEDVQKVIYLDDEAVAGEDMANLAQSAGLDNLAYIIYTSGTTGTPKGVAVEHKSLVNYVLWRTKCYGITEKDVTLQLLSVSFDAFGSNLYSSLLSGGCLVIPQEGKKGDFEYICSLIYEHGVTNMSVVPMMLKGMLEYCGGGRLKPLRFVVIGGDKADAGIINTCRELNSDLLLINEYGPTEATITAAYNMNMSPDNTAVVGRPVANTYIYILDENGSPSPVGIPGELCISGLALARGYLHSEEAGEKRFVPNPFYMTNNYERMYRTGDYARWRSDGSIELLGRMDRQVKIRGYRIDPVEVENALLDIDAIKSAVVMKKGCGGNMYLCAYFVSDKPMTVNEIKAALSERVAEYMIPAYFYRLDSIPLTGNGKINFIKLSQYKEAIGTGTQYVEISNEIEKQLIDIWKKVLKAEHIGTTESFFNIGGNSMLLMDVHAEINDKISKGVTIPDLFSYSTISELAEYIGKKNKSNHMPVNCIKIHDEYVDGSSNPGRCPKLMTKIPNELFQSMQDVAQSQKMLLSDIVVCALFYLMAEMSDDETISVYTANRKTNMVCQTNANMKHVESAKELLNYVCRVQDGYSHIVFGELAKGRINKAANEVMVLFHTDGFLSSNINTQDVFDMVFIFDVADQGIISFEYNARLLREAKMHEILGRYIDICRNFVNKYYEERLDLSNA